jgi:hypothetical protein
MAISRTALGRTSEEKRTKSENQSEDSVYWATAATESTKKSMTSHSKQWEVILHDFTIF